MNFLKVNIEKVENGWVVVTVRRSYEMNPQGREFPPEQIANVFHKWEDVIAFLND